MARGAAAKLRRRGRKKEDEARSDELFGSEEENGTHDFGPPDFPMPPSMSKGNEEIGTDEDEDEAAGQEKPEEESEDLLPKKSKKKKKSSRSAGGGSGGADMAMPPMKKSKQGIKSTPLILLIILTGTTLLPAVIFASDYIGNFMQKHHVVGQLGFRMGIGAVPRKRVLSFYEKHDPSKLDEVPKILSKHYGDYDRLIKKLERKYQDYGYFLGWQEDEAALTLALEQLHETYDLWLNGYWNRYAPLQLKTAARNIRYNLTFLHKKIHKIWKKKIWPVLEPFFGVPKGASAQKRKDAAEARQRKREASGSGTRRRNAEFRDETED